MSVGWLDISRWVCLDGSADPGWLSHTRGLPNESCTPLGQLRSDPHVILSSSESQRFRVGTSSHGNSRGAKEPA